MLYLTASNQVKKKLVRRKKINWTEIDVDCEIIKI